MKAVKIIFGILVLALVSLYIVLFTPLSKTIIVPIIESKISEASKINNVKIPDFELSFSSLKMKLLLEDQQIDIDTTFGLFDKTLDLQYKVDISDLGKFNYLTGQKLRGTFNTDGNLKGTFEHLKLAGDAKLAKGDINYNLNIDKNNINNIKTKIDSIDLAVLLNMIYQPKFVNGKFNAVADISSIELDQIIFDANIKEGIFNVPVFQNELNLTIPKSNFKLDTNVKLKNKSGDFVFNFDSQLIQLLTNGAIDLNSLNINSKYKISVDKLAMLEPIIKTKLNGSFSTKGAVKGDKKSMEVVGNSNIANSITTYYILLKDLAVDKVKANIKNAKLDKILDIVNQPSYAKANLNLDVDINSLKDLDGNIITTLDNGILNKKIVKKDFNISLPKNATFDLKAVTNLDKNIVDTKLSLKTFVANIQTKKTQFDIKTATLNTDYTAKISDLGKLYFITKQKMQGDLKIDGNVKFKDHLDASFSSNKFGGNINGTFIKEKLDLKIKDVDSLKLLDMLYYPKVYTSKIDLKLDYDIKTKKGISDLVMNNGKFLPNQLSQTIKKFIKKDLTTEIYKIANVKTKIDDKKLDSTLLMQSANSEIKSNKMYMDLEKSKIDAFFDIKYYEYKSSLDLKGKLTSPKVKVDTSKLIYSKAKQKVKEVIEKQIEDKLDDNLKKSLGGFLKKLF